MVELLLPEERSAIQQHNNPQPKNTLYTSVYNRHTI